jgi:HEAT repeat protein
MTGSASSTRTNVTARRTAFVAGALLAVLAGCGHDEPTRPKGSQPAQASAPSAAMADDRIAQWLSGCAHTEPFLADTSDPIPILVSKLVAGDVDPQREAREELVQYGAAAVPELRRAYEANFVEPFLSQRVQNVIEVLGLMEDTSGRDMIVRALDHGSSTVRNAAARALSVHGRPEDYDALMQAVSLAHDNASPDLVLGLLASDRSRAERQFVEWLQSGTMMGSVRALSARIVGTRDHEVQAALKPLYSKLEGDLRIHVETIVASIPDEGALAELRGWLRDTTQPLRRAGVAQDFARAGLAAELTGLLTDTDPDASLRLASVQAIAEAPRVDATVTLLRRALTDPDEKVREVALQALAAQLDPAAIDMALQDLDGSREELETGMRALSVPMQRDPKLAERVLDTLLDVHSGKRGSGLVTGPVLARKIGMVPLERAARAVMEIGAHAEGLVQDQPAHRFYTSAAANSGSAGMAYLRSLWATEADPVRRMDLVVAGTFEKSPATRQFLAEVVQSPRSTPPEVLLAASRVAWFGPYKDAAPLLKRVTLGINDARVRPALNCLMWTWYAASK